MKGVLKILVGRNILLHIIMKVNGYSMSLKFWLANSLNDTKEPPKTKTSKRVNSFRAGPN